MERMVFPSKVDWWVAVILYLAAATSLMAAIQLTLEGTLAGWGFALLTSLLGVALPIWVLRSTRYELANDELKVWSGPMRWTIPLCDIDSVTPTHNPLSSPALSIDRLRIDHRSGRLMISPRDKQGFLNELKQRQAAVRADSSGDAR